MSDKGLIKSKWLERYPRSFPQADKSALPVPGAVVVSRAGRDRYRTFIITEVLRPQKCEKSLRVLGSDGKLRKVSSPKKKNLSHLILVGMSEKASELISAGALTDSSAAELLEEFRENKANIQV